MTGLRMVFCRWCRAPALPVLALGLSLPGAGCARDAQLDRQLEQLASALREVEARGALRCAPRQLAVARSQVEFARLEREQGFDSRAREHLTIADENVQAARVLSPQGRCTAMPEPQNR